MSGSIDLSSDKSQFVLNFFYNRSTVDAIKETFPTSVRQYDPSTHQWFVAIDHAKDLLVLAENYQLKLTEAALDVAKVEIERMEKNIAASKAASSDLSVPAPPGLDYLPFQKSGIHYCLDKTHVLLADEMGLGKTIQALGVINSDVKKFKHVLVVAPASLLKNWAIEAKKWLVDKDRRTIYTIKGRQFAPQIEKRPGDTKEFGPSLRLVSYDSLAGHSDDTLLTHTYDLVIFDECHYLKNSGAQRTKLALSIKSRKNLFLSGTPLLNRPIELYPVLKHIGVSVAQNWKHFVEKYCDAYHDGYGYRVDGASNLPELQEKLRSSCMVRRLKKNVLTELPEKRTQVLIWEPSTKEEKEAIKAEAQLVKKIREEMDKGKKSRKGDEPKLSRERVRVLFEEIAQARKNTAIAKAPRVSEMCREMLQEGSISKLVVFGHHQEVIDTIKGALQGFGAVKFDGRDSATQKQLAVETFQTDPNCRVFVGSLRAAGVGLTLTEASTVVFAEQDWSPGVMQQAEDRLHRVGQKNSVLSILPLLEGSLDSLMQEKLSEKRAILEMALDSIASDEKKDVKKSDGLLDTLFGDDDPSPEKEKPTREPSTPLKKEKEEHADVKNTEGLLAGPPVVVPKVTKTTRKEKEISIGGWER